MLHPPETSLPTFFGNQDMQLSDFAELCKQTTTLTDYPLATSVEHNILIYDGEVLRQQLEDGQEDALKAELCKALRDGPGVFVIKRAYTDASIIDKSTQVFAEIVAAERASGQGQGDHFGNNERIWNAIQKVCVRGPELFVDYYGNPMLALACDAWLGPFYQISAQMNTVKPGSSAQAVHRDYHLGFQSHETTQRFPAHVQVMSQYLTLQGAIAHGDMPLESGPTRLLPYSQQFPAGYLTYRLPEFQAYFDEHQVQLPLEKGDMVFFSPALFHGAGTNTSENDRVANLVQISSAFGKTMETINTTAMIEAVYPVLKARVDAGSISSHEVYNTIAAAADGYSFPTNLDADPPVGGNAPVTQQQLMQQALDEAWSLETLQEALNAYAKRREA
ncbi:MAG: phytanoyl-CoA dioxygenase family protein [Deinococcota bacterium]